MASRTSQVEDTDGSPLVKSNPVNQGILFKCVQLNYNNQQEGAWKKSGSTEPFNRSLSVTKKSKKPPPPPSRSYSLHSRTYARTIAQHKPLENGSQKVESPYSPYTSQNVNPAVPSKENVTGQRAVLAELQLKEGRNITYSHSNGGSHQNNLKHFLPSIKGLSTNSVVASPAVATVLALLDVPNPPKVLAPPPPPPETWAHNQRTFELLCGPGPVNFERWAQKRGLKIEVPIQMTQGKKIATCHAANVMKDNTVTSKMQTQEATPSDMPYRITPTKISVNVQPPYGNTLPLTRLTHVRPSPSPSPPPEHIPPLPPTDHVNHLKEDISTQFQGPLDEVISPPPHPLFPPPPPPTNVPPPHLPHGQDETDYSSLPMPPSLRFLLKVPPVPQDAKPLTSEEAAAQKIPPPPQMIPPAPPMIPSSPPAVPLSSTPTPPSPPAIPPPPTAKPPPSVTPAPPPQIPPFPKAVPTPPKQIPPDTSSKQAQISSTPCNIPTPPPPPPLPVDIKKEIKAITADKQEKQSSPPTAHTEESPNPVVTPSLLQNVRLRSVRSNVSPAETPGGPPKPKHQTNQEAPQKPIRRSLILITPDVPSQSATDQKDDTLPATPVQENQNTIPPSKTQTNCKPKVLPGSAEVISLPVKLEPNSQVNITDQKTQQESTEPNKGSLSAEAVPQIHNKAEPEPKITGRENQNATPEPSTALTPAEPKNQPIANDRKYIQKNDSSKTDNKQRPPLVQPEQEAKLAKPQTLIPTSPKFNPVQKVPPAAVSSSMSLQEAIRLKTAAMTSTDSQAKRLSLLHSPPPSAGAISPTSMANFIFSKSTKKVVKEKSLSSLESKTDLKKTLVNELNSVSQTLKPAADPHNTKAKVPPPVAKKPGATSEAISHNSSESNVDTEHVHSAGQ